VKTDFQVLKLEFHVCNFKQAFYLLVSLFHIYSPVTRKRQWRNILDEFASALEFYINEFSGSFFDLFTVNLLLVRSDQADITVVKRLIQERSNATRRGWQLYRDHTVKILNK